MNIVACVPAALGVPLLCNIRVICKNDVEGNMLCWSTL